MTGGEFDEDVLQTAINRKDVLSALATEPHHRQEIQDRFDISKTTCHRIIRSFDEKGLIRRTEAGYEVTLLGHIIAKQVTQFEHVAETAYRLDPLLKLFESSDEEFDYSIFTDVDISWSVEQDQALIDSGVERVRNAERLRVLDWTPVPDLYIERLFGIMIENGIRSEAIYPKQEVKNRLENFPDLHDELLEAGTGSRYWVYEDVPPWGMTIYDDAVVELRAYDRETGAYVLDATSNDAPAVEWAENVFTKYRSHADPLTDVDDLPDWGDYSW